MRIHHIAILTDDIFRMKQFYETYFGAKSGSLYHNSRTGLLSFFLRFDDAAQGAQIEIYHLPHRNVSADCVDGAGYTHLCMSVGSREQVDALTERLKTDGYRVESAPRVTGDGYYESVVLDCDGNRLEITE